MANDAVVFIDTSPEVKKAVEKLARNALNASAKVLKTKLAESLPPGYVNLRNHIGHWTLIDRKTGQPTLRIGFYSWQKVKKIHKTPSASNPSWVEFGTKSHDLRVGSAKFMAYDGIFFGKETRHPGQKDTHILRNTVLDNIEEMKAAQEEHLAQLNKELEALKAIPESTDNGDGE